MSEIYKKNNVRGIRGATTIESNKSELIKDATKELLEKMVLDNNISTDDIAAVFFTTTPDISDEFPAVAAREMGWDTVPLICGHEMSVPHGLEKCIRILIMWNTEVKQKEIRHPYLRNAKSLRKSDNDFEAT
ncbi:MAG: chorismate mutase [Chloroflexota bacterium]|nr:chorismate mutase [Chloroflexota bacterium]|tara:strand:- start:1777 stop:2172 length:396 start_codon:yes stop_codon:yes gene_type:complete